jgi:hypothetical protein
LSKLVDNSEWVLVGKVVDELLEKAGRGGGEFTLDVFAGDGATWAGRFYSKYATLGSLGVNAFRHPWAVNSVTGSREFCLINGPFGKMGAIIRKVKEERCDGVLLYPDWPRYWRPMLGQLPVKEDWEVKGDENGIICTPGARVSGDKKKKRIRYAIRAALIVWGD